MYDTITMCYYCSPDDLTKVLNTQNCIKDLGQHEKNGVKWMSGNYRGLKVKFFYNKIVITGSICKWYLGDNMQTMGRKDMQLAIEKMSDELYLPLSRARVYRIDVAANIILRFPVKEYLKYLGKLKYFERLEQQNGLRYENKTRAVCFYDKIKQEKKAGENIPELYQNTNVLRYEYRLLKGIAKRFGVEYVTAEMLYNEDFYMSLLDEWEETYNLIYKIPIIDLKTLDMRNVKRTYSLGLLTMLKVYGEKKILSDLDTLQKEGKIKRKQKYDIKEAFKRAKEEESELIKESDLIAELSKRIREYIKFYR